MSKSEYEKGYNDALKAIEDIVNQMNGGGSGGQGGGSAMQQELADALSDLANEIEQQNGQGSSGGAGSSAGMPQGDQESGRGSGSRGKVQPSDCSPMGGGQGAPGGMVDRAQGDKIAQSEGYPDDGPSESQTENQWKKNAQQAAKKMGKNAGAFVSRIQAMFNTSTNWKKELRKIVGYSINMDDQRQAYANKNVLVSQNRIARTGKDKYDSMDYLMAVIDSSGSMTDEQLRLCLSEVYQVALQKKPLKLVVVQCDAAIQEITEYHSVQELKKSIRTATVKGRGGTDFKPVWNLLRSDKRYNRISPELLMIFTDGYCDQYKRDPRTMRNLAWIILDNPSFELNNKDAKTKVVYLKTEDIR